MAIKIINKGKDLDNPIFTQRCPNCDCVFTYQNEDAYRKPTGRYYRDFDIRFMDDYKQEITVSIECPWCHKKIHVRDEYI
jgi:uncharacterized C2H2 Zn-finger protein